MKQTTALDILKTGNNVFLTGSAGAGKTYTLNNYINYLRARRVPVAVTASTGIAATHMNGITIHSWSGIGIKSEMQDKDYAKIMGNKILRERIQDTAVLVIDEISMLHANQLNLVNKVLQYVRKSDEAFGGIQVILAGDFFQLPPVGNKGESNRDKFAFMSEAWLEADFKICYLTEQYRQKTTDSESDLSKLTLNDILNQIRSSQVTNLAVDTLNQTKFNQINDSRTQLYTHNFSVDKINVSELNKLDTNSKSYLSEGVGDKKLVEMLKKSVRTSDELFLKLGAKVMFIKNISDLGVFNGTMGEIVGFKSIKFEETQEKSFRNIVKSDNSNKYDDDTQEDKIGKYDIDDDDILDTETNKKPSLEYPVVRLNTGRKVIASPEEWMVEDEHGVVLASYKQVPLCLAWAITVHKSQGMTLDAAEIDLSRTFEMGQGYVALSRLKSLKGLKLLGLNETSLRLDPLARGADSRFMQLSNALEEASLLIDKKELDEAHDSFVLESGGTTNLQIIKNYEESVKRRKENQLKKLHKSSQGNNDKNTLEKTKELLLESLSIAEIAQERELAQSTIMGHIQQLKKIDSKLACDHLKPNDTIMILVEQAKSSIDMANDPNDFDQDGKIKLKPIYEYLEGDLEYNTIRLALIFLED